MSFDVSFLLGNGLSGMIQPFPVLLGIAAYVLTALGLFHMAESRCIRHPWLAWVPVADIWILGSLSDQYRYVVKGQIRSRRKLLLTLKIITSVLGTVIGAMAFRFLIRGMFSVAAGAGRAEFTEMLLELTLHAGGVAVFLLPVLLTELVFRFMALYDIYQSCEPDTSTLFLVLSIFFRFTEPFFLFFGRKKEKGMPPRKVSEAVSGTAGPQPASPQGTHSEPDGSGPQTPEFL